MESEKLDQILSEISEFEVNLVDDPTLPEHGVKYLLEAISKCRSYLNRVQHYLQIVSGQEKILKRLISVAKTDIELKVNGLLADDPIVRKQPSIDDRRAVAISMLSSEYQNVGELEARLLDLSETIKIIKMKYNDLRATNSDIKTQRQLVRDDRDLGPDGGTERNQDRSIPNGLPPRADRPKISPDDILDDSKRPDDIPAPKDKAHARQMSDFFNSMPRKEINESKEDKIVINADITYEDLLS